MKYVLAVFAAIVVMILAIILIATRGTAPPQQSGSKQLTLVDYLDRDTTLVFTQQGRIVGEQDYREVRISVNRLDRRIEIIQGYQNTVIKSQTFANNTEAFATFARSLELAGYTRQRSSQFKSEVGVCPLGNRFIYEITVAGEEELRSWSTTCGLQGTFGGNVVTTQRLFRDQIPGYSSFVSGNRL